MMKQLTLVLLFATLTACSDQQEKVDVQENVFQTQINAYDKATETTQALEDAMQKQQQGIEESGGW